MRHPVPLLSSVGRAAVVAWLLAIPAMLAAQPAQMQQTAEVRQADSLFAARAYRDAFAAYERLTRIDSGVPRYWMQLGMSAALTKNYVDGARAFEHASALRAGPVAAYNAGTMHARLGHADSAFTWLTRAVNTGFSDTTTLATDDDLASLRDDPRFMQLREAMLHTPAPCRNDPVYRQFDFWAGNWRVTTQGGAQVGTSHVDVISGGCALLENWHDMRDGEGKSINTFDPASKQWRQFWVGQGGAVTDYRESTWHDGSLSFFVHFPSKTGPDAIMRLTFSPLADGTVRQHSELSTDAGKSWTTQYDFYYHRVP